MDLIYITKSYDIYVNEYKINLIEYLNHNNIKLLPTYIKLYRIHDICLIHMTINNIDLNLILQNNELYWLSHLHMNDKNYIRALNNINGEILSVKYNIIAEHPSRNGGYIMSYYISDSYDINPNGYIYVLYDHRHKKFHKKHILKSYITNNPSFIFNINGNSQYMWYEMNGMSQTNKISKYNIYIKKKHILKDTQCKPLAYLDKYIILYNDNKLYFYDMENHKLFQMKNVNNITSKEIVIDEFIIQPIINSSITDEGIILTYVNGKECNVLKLDKTSDIQNFKVSKFKIDILPNIFEYLSVGWLAFNDEYIQYKSLNDEIHTIKDDIIDVVVNFNKLRSCLIINELSKYLKSNINTIIMNY